MAVMQAITSKHQLKAQAVLEGMPKPFRRVLPDNRQVDGPGVTKLKEWGGPHLNTVIVISKGDGVCRQESLNALCAAYKAMKAEIEFKRTFQSAVQQAPVDGFQATVPTLPPDSISSRLETILQGQKVLQEKLDALLAVWK